MLTSSKEALLTEDSNLNLLEPVSIIFNPNSSNQYRDSRQTEVKVVAPNLPLIHVVQMRENRSRVLAFPNHSPLIINFMISVLCR